MSKHTNNMFQQLQEPISK